MDDLDDGWARYPGETHKRIFQTLPSELESNSLESPDLLSQDFAYKFIELMWLELTTMDSISFQFDPDDDFFPDSFIGFSPEDWNRYGIEGDRNLEKLYSPRHDEKPWVRIEYTIMQDLLRQMRDEGELDDFIDELAGPKWENDVQAQALNRFITSDVDLPVDESIMQIFVQSALEHVAPGYGCVDFEIIPIESELSERLDRFPWRWSTLTETQKHAVVGMIIELKENDEDELGWYMGYLISIHPNTPKELKAWLALDLLN